MRSDRPSWTGEHLWFLAIAYWVTGGVTAFIALYGLVYVAMGVMIAVSPNNDWVTEPGQAAPPDLFGWFLAGIGVAMVLLCAIVAALQVLTGFWIRKRRRRVLCMVVAGITCLGIPYGTLLGVLTFIVLGRSSVGRCFAPSGPGMEAAPPSATVVQAPASAPAYSLAPAPPRTPPSDDS